MKVCGSTSANTGTRPRGPGELRDHPERQGREDNLGSGRQPERMQQVEERDAAVGGGHASAKSRRRRAPQRRARTPPVGAPHELAAGAELCDRLLGIGNDTRAVAGNSSQHVTALEIVARSPLRMAGRHLPVQPLNEGAAHPVIQPQVIREVRGADVKPRIGRPPAGTSAPPRVRAGMCERRRIAIESLPVLLVDARAELPPHRRRRIRRQQLELRDG